MKFLFSFLPEDMIKYILLFDEHFIMRKGEIISIIPKTDNRYNLLNFITFNLDYVEIYGNTFRYNYYFSNLHNYEGRRISNSDLMQVTLYEHDDIIYYAIWIGKQYPKSLICNKPQNYYIEDPDNFNWIYTEFKYERV